MSLSNLDGLWWLLVLLGPLLLFQRRLHLETQLVFYLLTMRQEIALALFSLIFFPGVLLHESSHWIMARLLGVRTGRFSLLPRSLPDGRLQLGYVETASTDLLREALIGLAPLLAGGAFVAYAGINRLGLPSVWEQITLGSEISWLSALGRLPTLPDFWLWFYLTFTISATMLPSRSDRRAWLPLTLAAIVLITLGLLAGAGPWMVENIAPRVNLGMRAAAVVLAISLAVHLVLVLPLALLRLLLSQWRGVKLQTPLW